MKYLIINIFILVAFSLKSQDKVFFIDGTTKSGKITEIAPEEITIKIAFENFSFPRNTILLLEFANGTFEIINTPQENITSVSSKKENFHYKQPKKEIYNFNHVSINTLALCNADIAAFYERILPIKKIGIGVMGAYNFNLYATTLNTNIILLSNAKKNYDFGGFINIYPGHIEKKTRMHFGIMLKYTSFNFSSVTVLPSSITTYKPSKGSQLATIVTTGTHTNLTHNIFIKTIFGIGAFKLKGDYKQQYNQELNNANQQSTNNPNAQPVNYNFLPKFYFGLNVGLTL